MKAITLIASILSLFALTSCAQEMNSATKGALTGSALGAGVGAIVGNQTGDAKLASVCNGPGCV